MLLRRVRSHDALGVAFVTPARAYTALVVGVGAALLAMRLPAIQFDQPWTFVALLVTSAVLSISKVRLPLTRGSASLSMSYFTDFLALVLLGPDQGMLVAGISGATQCVFVLRARPSFARTAFSAAVLMVAMQVTGLLAGALGGFPRESTFLVLGRVTLATSSAFFIMNSGLVAIAVALSRRASIARTWYDAFFWTAPACLIGAALAVLLTRTSSALVWAPVLAAGPLLVTFKAYQIFLGRVEAQQRHLKEVSDLHLASVEALARAIDARDQTIDQARAGENHIRRLQAWAIALAEAAGLGPEDVEAVKVAALLHDIGKLAVPEHILTKPGPLTPKEFARVRIHPVVGAEIIKAVPFPYPVASLIRSHHERWDGSGYPDGLRAEETPLGARVLAVVDYFDALRSNRPYHGPANRHEAIATLRSEAGRALDPSLVALFLTILPSLESADVTGESALEMPAKPPSDRGTVVDIGAARGRVAPAWVFHNISLATQEMRALHDIAQTLGTRLSVDDTMALLTAKLNRLVPGSCWVLYLHDPSDDVLRCRFATGLPADVAAQLIIPAGAGASGWAARHRTAVLNAPASADFEAAGLSAAERALHSALSYPLVDDDVLIGTLTVYHAEREPFREEHRHVLDHISAQAASVLRNAVDFERMRDVSFTDPLTELPNSRALADFLRRRVVDAPEAPVPSALIMIDLDDFKAVNDGHGHQKGDAALHAVAAAIRHHVRGSDFCARYGGDEFVAVLSGCDRAEAEQRARHLQQAVAQVPFASASGAVLNLGISVGVSVFPDDGTSIDALITAADRRMYLDKSARRVVSEPFAIS
jgi:diguanylate cyclase (GGDEF)-like protein/putative nucleotidyltransferase with HDIG domain